VRTPVIPGATDAEENITAIGRHIAADGRAVTRWELCAFNNLCADKYRRLGNCWEFEGCSCLPVETMDRLATVARNSGVNPEIVVWSGATG
jgi:pyruvate formate lyase activating enzyme